MKITRYIQKHVKSDLNRKMVFIGGPRQVGKTTFAKSFLQKPKQYLNWDDLKDRESLKKHDVDPNLKVVCLDEIHKYSRWRMLVKGLFDKFHESLSIIVTGSARLDYFRKGGDSLFGRFHFYRLHPLSLAEVDTDLKRETTLRLLRFGGFPEPYFNKNENDQRRWSRERLSRVVYQDISDLSLVKEISMIELLVDMLPVKVGSVLSINSIREDLDVSPNTVAKWIEVLELVYYCYRIAPFGSPKIRAVKKSNKLYLWDWSQVPEAGPRFENFVASQLLKYCHFIEDTQGHKMELRFLRDTDLREIDFVVLKDNKPIFAVECKAGDKEFSKHLYYFKERTAIPQFYQVHLGSKERIDGSLHLLPFESLCRILKLP